MKNGQVKSVFDWLLKTILKIGKSVSACAWKKREEKRNGLNHNMQGLGLNIHVDRHFKLHVRNGDSSSHFLGKETPIDKDSIRTSRDTLPIPQLGSKQPPLYQSFTSYDLNPRHERIHPSRQDRHQIRYRLRTNLRARSLLHIPSVLKIVRPCPIIFVALYGSEPTMLATCDVSPRTFFPPYKCNGTVWKTFT